MSAWPEVTWGGPNRRSAPSGARTPDYNATLARIANEAPRIPWDKFTRSTFRWNVGEHVGLIGPTGQGKTTLLRNLLPMRRFVTVFATKPRDDTMERLIRQGYVRLDRWRSLDADEVPRRVVWPDASQMDSVANQRAVFKDAFERIYREGGWTVAIDELWYFSDDGPLRMSDYVRLYLLQARALDISLVVASQRPSRIPLEVYDQSTHLFFWRDNDEANLARISGIGTRSASIVREVVSNLEQFQVLYVNTRTGVMARTRVPYVAESVSADGRRK